MLPNRQDYRILVLNHLPLGAMLRKATKNQFVSNFSAGGLVASVPLTKPMRELSIQLSQLLKLDFAGIDLMKDQRGQLRVLEVNRFPEFIGFEQATRVNVSSKIESFLSTSLGN
jgi:glutathione synthase/RimK-type ligase-like ATP-grasp enzyme